jgi:DNA-binding transcriptional ArsR family regulator
MGGLMSTKDALTLQAEAESLHRLLESSRDRAGCISDILKALSHPDRLRVMCLLASREMSVGEIESETGLNQSSVSQHLAQLRSHRLVRGRKERNFVFYRVANRKVLQLFSVLKSLSCSTKEDP